ncbi:hypothetical protein D3C84_1057920 [compost metagenome]
MLAGILDERLHAHFRHWQPIGSFVDANRIVEPVREAEFLNLQIHFSKMKLLTQRDQILGPIDHPAQQQR